ncbi:MAG: hypothetical protein ACOYB4_02890 [Methyloceanibacter sp.]
MALKREHRNLGRRFLNEGQVYGGRVAPQAKQRRARVYELLYDDAPRVARDDEARPRVMSLRLSAIPDNID